MPVTLRVVIPGTPIGKPRMTRRDKWAKRPCVLRYWEWADSARAAVRRQITEMPPAERVRRLTLLAYFAPPDSWSRRRKEAAVGTLHRQRPDADNLAKCLDALYREDAGLACLTIEKRWDWVPRLELFIELEEDL